MFSSVAVITGNTKNEIFSFQIQTRVKEEEARLALMSHDRRELKSSFITESAFSSTLLNMLCKIMFRQKLKVCTVFNRLSPDLGIQRQSQYTTSFTEFGNHKNYRNRSSRFISNHTRRTTTTITTSHSLCFFFTLHALRYRLLTYNDGYVGSVLSL